MVGSVGEMDRDTAGGRLSTRAFSGPRHFLLFAGLVCAAIGAVASFAVVALDAGDTVTTSNLLIATAAFSVSQLARIKLRMGSAVVILAWGEVGVVAVLCLVPAAWTPVVVCVAAVIAHSVRFVEADMAKRARTVAAIAAVTLGSVAAAALVILTADSTAPLRVDLQRPVTFLPPLAASLLYFVLTTLLISMWIAAASRHNIGSIWLKTLRGKRPMLAGNVAVGLAVAVVLAVDVVWLAALLPVLWLLHEAYKRQMRAAAEERTWAALADATRELSQLDERAVAVATLHGAAELFAPTEVEVLLERPSGRRRRYFAPMSDITDLASAPDGVITTDTSAEVDRTRHILVRKLVVGDTRIGELRLLFRKSRTARQFALSSSEEHAFSTFADAVASALHDAATHRQLQAMAARSAYDAVHDVLTGLSNRSTLLARGNAQLLRMDAESRGVEDAKRPVALVLLDIDGLRTVNDALSYAAGDEMLKVIASRLANSQRQGELLGRLGDDEFAILITNGPDDRANASGEWTYPVERAREFISALASPAAVSGVTIAMEASAGVVVETAGGCDMIELLRRADVALRQAKGEVGRVACYDAVTDVASTDRLVLLAELRDALSTTDQLLLYVQPTVNLLTGAPVGAEALLRWRHPRRGLLPPAEFVHAVEHSELASGLTRYVIDMALEIVAGWAEHSVGVPISVNVCARCMLNPELPALVEGQLKHHGVDPGRLILEITEAVMSSEVGVVAEVIAGMRAVGVQVSVDDFGTEAASLAFLTRFAVDEVKIDRVFVATMAESPETAAIVRAMVDLARELGLRVVAEGVERPEQRTALVDLGVTAAQGFLFHAAMPAEEATATLRAAQ